MKLWDQACRSRRRPTSRDRGPTTAATATGRLDPVIGSPPRLQACSARRRHQRQGRLPAALEIEQQLLAPETAAVAAELAVLVDHAMTGDDDRDAVLTVGVPHGALGARSFPF